MKIIGSKWHVRHVYCVKCNVTCDTMKVEVQVTHLGETFPVTVRADVCQQCGEAHYSKRELEENTESALMAHLVRRRDD